MSLFFRKSEQRSGDWSDYGWSGSGNSSRAAARATHLVPVYAALRHITDYVATLPVDSFWKNLDGTRQPAPTPRLLREVNEFGPGVGPWFAQAAYGIAVDGNAVGWISEADGFGRPAFVRWLQRADWSFDELTHQWYVNASPVPASRILHIPWMVPPGKVLGLSPIEHFAATISAGLSAQEYADIRRGGGVPPTVLKNDSKTIDKDQADRISRRAEQSFSTGRPLVLGADWEFSAVAIPPNHAQFIETLKLTANQSAAIYGLDPIEVGGEASNSQEYSNEEFRQIKRAANMRPYLTRLEDAVSRVLSDRQFIRFDIGAHIRVDLKTQAEVLKIEIDSGQRSVNEARAIKDMPPVPGGDFHNVPAPSAAPTQRDEGDAL